MQRTPDDRDSHGRVPLVGKEDNLYSGPARHQHTTSTLTRELDRPGLSVQNQYHSRFSASRQQPCTSTLHSTQSKIPFANCIPRKCAYSKNYSTSNRNSMDF